MRRLPIDHCPVCGVISKTNTYCARCGVDMVDANGHGRIEPEVLSRTVRFSRRTLLGALAFLAFWSLMPNWYTHLHGYAATLRLRAITFCAMGAVFIVVRLVRRAREGVRAAVRRASVSPIASVDSPNAGIRGRVVVLRPAGAASPDVAARIVRHDEVVPSNRRTVSLYSPVDREATVTLHKEASVCGRFAVIDETGVAIVEDDAIVFEDDRPRSERSSLDALREGDVVDVFGPASRRAAMDAHTRANVPLVHARHALVFDGTPKDKVHVVVRRAPRSVLAA